MSDFAIEQFAVVCRPHPSSSISTLERAVLLDLLTRTTSFVEAQLIPGSGVISERLSLRGDAQARVLCGVRITKIDPEATLLFRKANDAD